MSNSGFLKLVQWTEDRNVLNVSEKYTIQSTTLDIYLQRWPFRRLMQITNNLGRFSGEDETLPRLIAKPTHVWIWVLNSKSLLIIGGLILMAECAQIPQVVYAVTPKRITPPAYHMIHLF